MTKLKQAGGEERFDKRFGLGVFIHNENDIVLDKIQLFDFISDGLSRQRAEIVERIKNMSGTIPLGELSTIVWFRKDDVLSALEKEKV